MKLRKALWNKDFNVYNRLREEVAGELGLEPRMTVPKTAVLPLHHSPAGTAAGGPRGEADEIAQACGQINAPTSLAEEKSLLYKRAPQVGVWLSLVEHRVRDAGVAGSNPATPTISSAALAA